MRIWIGYGSKYGYTRKMVEQLADALEAEVTLQDLKQKDKGSWQHADALILGGSVYAGRLRKEVRSFAAQNKAELLSKPLGLFLCGMQDKEESEAAFRTNFDAELLSAAKVKAFLGGAFQIEKMNVLEKTIIKKVAKGEIVMEKDYPEELERLAEAMK